MKGMQGLVAGVAVGALTAVAAQQLMRLRPRKPLKVLITGAAGQIGYALCPMVAAGRMLGPDQPVILHLLDIEPSQNALNGVRMELIDAAYPLLQAVHTFTSVEAAAKGVHVAVMVGGYPRKAGEERKDVMAKNVSIYKSQASALAQHAAKGVKIVVVANPGVWGLQRLPAPAATCCPLQRNHSSVREEAQGGGAGAAAHSLTLTEAAEEIGCDVLRQRHAVELGIQPPTWPAAKARAQLQTRLWTTGSLHPEDPCQPACLPACLPACPPAANTNALILRENAPGIPAENITCLTRLDHNRAVGQVSERTGTHNTEVRNVIIWGNHSSTQYPDVNHGTVKGQPIRQAVADDAWLNSEFITTVQQRGAAIIKARGLSSALSAASSVCDHVRDWVLGTPCGRWVSMGVVSDGSYGVAPGLVFSYPVKCSGGKWSIVQGLKLDPASKALLAATEAELLEEKELASQCLAGK
ncbi:hypothetical protein QJQ45_015272 [Haematococcus lacustris]|nr:hypothetical protein QJQ45_015272 [Haematococcus lacustris]